METSALRTLEPPRNRVAHRIRRSVPATLLTVLSVLAAMLLAPGVAVAGAHGGSTHGSHRGSVTVPLPVGLRPEGITSGPGTRYYVGSLANGRIVTGDLQRGGKSRVLLPGADGRQIRGLYWDRRTGLLWAVGNLGPARQDGTARVWAVSSGTGAIVKVWTIPGGLFLNDLVVTRNAVWVTDSGSDRLTRIALDRHGRPTSTSPTFLPLAGSSWPATAAGTTGANGIRTLPNGDLLLDNSTSGGLWAVNRATGATTRITVVGTQLTGGDGLLRTGRTVFVVRGTANTVVDQLKLSVRGKTWTATYQRALTDRTLDVPSTATLAGGSLWAVNARFGVASPENAKYWITKLKLSGHR